LAGPAAAAAAAAARSHGPTLRDAAPRPWEMLSACGWRREQPDTSRGSGGPCPRLRQLPRLSNLSAACLAAFVHQPFFVRGGARELLDVAPFSLQRLLQLPATTVRALATEGLADPASSSSTPAGAGAELPLRDYLGGTGHTSQRQQQDPQYHCGTPVSPPKSWPDCENSVRAEMSPSAPRLRVRGHIMG
jgi:hypothetical protein